MLIPYSINPMNRLLFLPILASLAVALPVPLPAQKESAPVDPLAETLEMVEAHIELHEWLSLLDLADAKHRETQIGMGMSHAQYIAELLGLNFEGNSLTEKDEQIDQSHLSKIRQVELKRRKQDGEWIAVIGTVTLSDGTVLILEVNLQKQDSGYVLTGAVG